MFPNVPLSWRSASLVAMALCVGLSGCAGGGRRGPPGGGEGPPGMDGRAGGQSRGAGVSAQPISVFLAGLDADADMVVSRSEAQLGAAIAWEAIGQPTGLRALGYADWQEAAFGGPQAHPAYVAFDNNFDGVIDQAEFMDFFEREFAALDRDGDGLLRRSELITRQVAAQPGRSEGQGRGPDGGRGGPPGGGQPPGR